MSYIKISIVSIIMSRADIKINDDVSINIEKLEVAIRTDHYTKSDLKEIILNGGFPYLKQPCSKSEPKLESTLMRPGLTCTVHAGYRGRF